MKLHYYAIIGEGAIDKHMDGIAHFAKIESMEDYTELKKLIADYFRSDHSKLTICSLTVLPDNQETVNNEIEHTG